MSNVLLSSLATTAIMALMVNQYATINPDYAVLLCFLAGCIVLVLGLLNMGVLVRFISIPVITGFTMAAATTIGSAQINNIVGLSSEYAAFVQIPITHSAFHILPAPDRSFK